MTGSRPAYRAFLSRFFPPGRVYTLVGAGGVLREKGRYTGIAASLL